LLDLWQQRCWLSQAAAAAAALAAAAGPVQAAAIKFAGSLLGQCHSLQVPAATPAVAMVMSVAAAPAAARALQGKW